MYKTFFAFVFSFIFYLSLSSTTSAFYVELEGQGPYAGTTFSVHAYNDEIANEEWIKDSVPIKINIEARDSAGNPQELFPSNKSFFIRLAQVDGSGNTKYTCDSKAPIPGFRQYTSMDDHGKRKEFTDAYKPIFLDLFKSNRPNANQVSFTVKTKGWICDLTPGTYRFEFFSDDKSYAGNWFAPFDFAIQSAAGGGPPKLDYASSQEKFICKNRTTRVQLFNVVPGQVYRLWWDGHTGFWAWKDRVTSSSPIVDVTGGDGYLPLGGQKLCILEGDATYILGQSLGPAALSLTDWRFKCVAPLEFTATDDANACNATLLPSCKAAVDPALLNTNKKRVTFTGSNLGVDVANIRADISSKDRTDKAEPDRFADLTPYVTGSSSKDITWATEWPKGNYNISLFEKGTDRFVCGTDFFVDDKVDKGNGSQNTPAPSQQACDPTKDPDKKCTRSGGEVCNSGAGINTVIGCVPTDPSKLMAGLFRYISGFAGGIALLMMVFGSFRMITSAGNADAIKNGREQFVSAVMGLLFVLFSVLFLQIVGVDILGLPGFTK